MSPLYKYLPSKFALPVLKEGKILFRNLTYFRQHEGTVRGDIYEGAHRDHPGRTSLTANQSCGANASGDFEFHNSINQDLVFAFCLSTKMSRGLLKEFECDSCIEIFDPDGFIQKIRFEIARLISTNKRAGLISKQVNYYKPSAPARFDIKNPHEIAFSKEDFYSHQAEHRLCFGTKNSFELIQKIVRPPFDMWAEAMRGECKEKTITIGRIENFARLVDFQKMSL